MTAKVIRDTIAHVEGSPLFKKMGSGEGRTVHSVRSLSEVMHNIESEEYNKLQLDVHNSISSRLYAISRERFSDWNLIAREGRKFAADRVSSRFDATVFGASASMIRKNIEWDIQHLYIEAAFSDLIPPAFYSAKAFWYCSGRLPCGWLGSYPDGKLVVY